MTFIAGWKHLNTVFLIADSVLTIETHDPNKSPLPTIKRKFSSFGEAHVNEGDVQMLDGELKIVRVSESVAVAYAGILTRCYNFTRDLQDRLRYGGNAVDIVRTLCEEVAEDLKDCAFIFAIKETSGESLLAGWNANRFNGHDYFLVAGNVDIQFAVDTLGGINLQSGFVLNEGRHQEYLISICAVLQHRTISDYILWRGYGGFFYGLCSTPSGQEWLKNTAYVIYSDFIDERSIDTFIETTFRDNIAVLRITTQGEPLDFFVYQNCFKVSHGFSIQLASEIDPFFFVFLNSSRPVMTVVTKEKNDSAQFIRITREDDTRLTFDLDQEFVEKVLLRDVDPTGSFLIY